MSREISIQQPIRSSEADDPRGVRGHGDALFLLGGVVLVALAWLIVQAGWIQSGDRLSYWIAVVGALMMVALLSYPLRKYARFMKRLGKVKWWFVAHICMGIIGPWLILVHSTFRIGSLNAGVALVSMCTVVLSGVVGRFIYVRVRRGLHGERTTFQALRERAGMVESHARSRLYFAPTVEARLLAFEQRELNAAPTWPTHLRQVLLLPLAQRIESLRCHAELNRRLRQIAADKRWQPDELARRLRRSQKLVNRYLDAVVTVAQYTAYERVFALWHVAHLPFVYLLGISAVVHVVAVHAY